MKVKTFLPVFSGFYGTIWEFDYNYIEDFIKEERKEKNLYSDVDFNDLKIDNETFENDIVNLFCEALPDFMPDFIEKIELEKIVRPKYYNFSNDSANVIITIKPDEVKSFIYANKEKFFEFLKKRYTSYNGFISHYENDFQAWESITENFSDFSCDGHRIGAILDFIAIMKKIDNYSIYETIFENVDFLSYVENLEDVINKNDGSLFEFLTFHGIEKSFADYIDTSFNNNVINQLCLSEKILSLIKEYKNLLVEA